ncbi:hypothetical protein THTE_0139 [Thermogutta terrifontis]|uniref:Uncharacterized protein n=1 Tax=Thermogutta terrifontis TaxID=1331910 RepID=A0A286R9V9_9BACT|nr:hypothetical protein THTE_0139 [Thermogutta terrifontis]
MADVTSTSLRERTGQAGPCGLRQITVDVGAHRQRKSEDVSPPNGDIRRRD